MLRWITAGESHGPELIGVIEGLPAGVEILESDLSDALARRRLGYGRGARMKFEQDVISLSAGIRFGDVPAGPAVASFVFPCIKGAVPTARREGQGG